MGRYTSEYEWLADAGETHDGVAVHWTTVCYGTVSAGATFLALIVGMTFGALGDGILLQGTIKEGLAYSRDHTVGLLLSLEHLGTFLICAPMWFGAWLSAHEARRLRPLHALLSVALSIGILAGLESMGLFK